MSDDERERWDRRYREGEYRARTWPSEFLDQWLARLPRGRALDLACGAGRNALHLAANGYAVEAIDISAVAIERAREAARERGLAVDFRVADLDDVRLAPDAYDLVTCIRYQNRRTMHRLPAVLREGGFLLFEQHFLTAREVGGPPWGTFRLRPNELLERFVRVLRVVHYEEGLVCDPDGREMALARFVACRGSPGY